jgi:hypothetical protein
VFLLFLALGAAAVVLMLGVAIARTDQNVSGVVWILIALMATGGVAALAGTGILFREARKYSSVRIAGQTLELYKQNAVVCRIELPGGVAEVNELTASECTIRLEDRGQRFVVASAYLENGREFAKLVKEVMDQRTDQRSA